MAYCPSCGVEVAAEARFCSQCGVALQAGSAAAQPTGSPPPAVAAAAAAAPQGDGQAVAASRTEPLWIGWPCRKRHLPRLAIALVLAIGGAIAAAAGAVPLAIVSGLALLWLLWIAGQMLLDPIRLRYWVTIDRLFIRRGILARTVDQTELIRVDDIRVSQGLIDRMLGIGNVEVVAQTDRTDGNATLLGVSEPMKVAEIIRENMRNLRQRRGMYIENV